MPLQPLLSTSSAIRSGKLIITIALLASLVGCASTSIPTRPENLCHIFEDKRGWHYHALKMNERWKVPVHVPMAMMYQESSFIHNARPPRTYFLGFIPTGRVSSAYGYSQALDRTWADYQKAIGNSGAKRDRFSDSIDFMGWYIDRTNTINRISKWDAKHQYLNYHEGWGGYRNKTYLRKSWLPPVADRVDARSKRYASQYNACRSSLSESRIFR